MKDLEVLQLVDVKRIRRVWNWLTLNKLEVFGFEFSQSKVLLVFLNY